MTSEFFHNNRNNLQALAAASGPIVIAANGLAQRNGDTTFAFRQDSSFYYLTGINEPDLTLVIDRTSDYLIAPGRSEARTIFDGAPDASALTKASGISEILDEKTGWQKLVASLKNSKSIATLAPLASYERRHGFYSNPARARLVRKLKRLAPKPEIIYINRTLAEMRMIKQPVEIEAIQKAIDITASGIELTASSLASYEFEYEIEAELARHFRASGASGHAFTPIVASGKNACTLHNVANNSKLASGSLVVIDVGAEYENYAADITRTLATTKPSARQTEVYDAVLAAQNFALELLKPGASFKEYEQSVASFLGEKLVELKLISSASDTASVRKFCPHATTHFLGLDTHDVGDYRQPLAENMVVTCEPGIYIPAEGIGVRIEDDVLIRAAGNQVLTQKLSRQLAAN